VGVFIRPVIAEWAPVPVKREPAPPQNRKDFMPLTAPSLRATRPVPKGYALREMRR